MDHYIFRSLRRAHSLKVCARRILAHVGVTPQTVQYERTPCRGHFSHLTCSRALHVPSVCVWAGVRSGPEGLVNVTCMLNHEFLSPNPPLLSPQKVRRRHGLIQVYNICLLLLLRKGGWMLEGIQQSTLLNRTLYALPVLLLWRKKIAAPPSREQ